MRNRPGLNLDESDVPGESAEPFSFDSLTGWQVRTQLMSAWLESGELAFADIETHLRRDGVLAEGQAGKKQMRTLAAELQDFVRHFEAKSGQRPDFSGMEADVTVAAASGNTYRISAMHPFMHANTAWHLEAGKAASGIPPKKKVRYYLAHLVFNAVRPVQTRVVLRDGKELIFGPLKPAGAHLRLGNFMSLYEIGFSRPLPFFPASMGLYLEALRNGQAPEQAFEFVLDELSEEPGMFAKEYHTEMDSIWVREAWGDANPLEDGDGREFCEVAGQPVALQQQDFERCQLFTLTAVRLIDVMNADLLKEALDASDERFRVDEQDSGPTGAGARSSDFGEDQAQSKSMDSGPTGAGAGLAGSPGADSINPQPDTSGDRL